MEFTLDYSKWRCGAISNKQLGEGPTALLNEWGYQCCLGQFSEQLGFSRESLLNKAYPGSISNRKQSDIFCHIDIGTTTFAQKAININDSDQTTPEQKIEALKQLFSEHGHSITVINQP
jgi:hypothetical protein